MYYSGLHSIFHFEYGICEMNGLCKGRCRKISIHCGLWEEIFKSAFQHIYVAINVRKLTYGSLMYKSVFQIKNFIISVNFLCLEHIKDVGYIVDYNRKEFKVSFHLISTLLFHFTNL